MVVILEGGWNKRLILMKPLSEKLNTFTRQINPHWWLATSFGSF